MLTTTARRHHRHRALAELDRLIGRAEAARGRCSTDTVGPEPTRAGIILGLAEERLASLWRSREALRAGEARQPG